jgi:hypothetical protein
MAKITRATQKLFGSDGPSGDFGQFGSLAAGSANYTKDPATIQALSAWTTGWAAATISNNRPALEDMNSLFYLAYYQLGYLLQQGIAEWDSGTTYYTGSFATVSGVVYVSLQDSNLNKDPATETAYWQNYKTSTLEAAYPVGSIYLATVSTNPATLLGFGTWTAYGEGKVLVGKASAGTFSTAGATGGAETVTSSNHTHSVPIYGNSGTGAIYVGSGSGSSFTAVTGVGGTPQGGSYTGIATTSSGSESLSVLQPYVVVYMWNRTA